MKRISDLHHSCKEYDRNWEERKLSEARALSYQDIPGSVLGPWLQAPTRQHRGLASSSPVLSNRV